MLRRLLQIVLAYIAVHGFIKVLARRQRKD